MTQGQNEAGKPNRELSALRAYLDQLPHGKVADPTQVELLLSRCWNDLSVASQTNGCAASDLVRAQGRQAWGVLYEIPDEFIRGERTDQQKTLAEIEGPRYEETMIRVRNCEGQEVNAVTFVVRNADRWTGLATSAAYVSWIVYGLRDHGVPEDYITHVLEVAVETNGRAREGAAKETKIIKTL